MSIIFSIRGIFQFLYTVQENFVACFIDFKNIGCFLIRLFIYHFTQPVANAIKQLLERNIAQDI